MIDVDGQIATRFVQVAKPFDGLSGLLPGQLFTAAAPLSVYVSPQLPMTATEMPGVLRPVWEPGTLLLVRPEDAGVPSFTEEQPFMETLPNCPPGHPAAPVDVAPHNLDALLLGFPGTLVYMRLSPGATKQLCARRLGVEPDDLFLLRQWHPFPSLVVTGQAVRHVYAWRLISQMGARRGTGIFVDARPLGQSVQFVRVFTDTLSVLDLLGMLGVEVPQGFQPMWSAAFDDAAQPAVVMPTHGDSFRIWLRRAASPVSRGAPSVPSRRPARERDGESDDEDVGRHESTGGGGAWSDLPTAARDGDAARNSRSRSPRRDTSDAVGAFTTDEVMYRGSAEHATLLGRRPRDTSDTPVSFACMTAALRSGECGEQTGPLSTASALQQRVIPTPCRSRGAPLRAEVDDLVMASPLDQCTTLLEKSNALGVGCPVQLFSAGT